MSKPTSNLSDRRPLFALYLVMVSAGTGQTVVFAILPMLGRELALHEMVFNFPLLGWQFAPKELAITAMSAMTALIFFLVTPFWGRKSDLIGRKPMILTGLVGYTCGTLLFNGVAYAGLTGALSGGMLYAMLVLTRAMHASVMSASMPAATAYMVDVTDAHNRTKGVSKLAAANQLGSMFGPALAIFVTISYLAPLFIQAGISFVIAVVVYRYLPDLSKAQGEGRPVPDKLRYFDPRFRRYIAIGFIMYMMLGMVQQTLGFYFQDVIGLDGIAAAQYYSLAMVVSAASMLFSQLVIVQRFPLSPLQMLRLGLPLCMFGYFVLANATGMATLLAGMGLYGLGMGLAGPGYTVSATLAVRPQEQGALAGLVAACAGLGFVVGPLAGGALYAQNPTFPYWGSALVLIPLILFVYIIKPPVTQE